MVDEAGMHGPCVAASLSASVNYVADDEVDEVEREKQLRKGMGLSVESEGTKKYEERLAAKGKAKGKAKEKHYEEMKKQLEAKNRDLESKKNKEIDVPFCKNR